MPGPRNTLLFLRAKTGRPGLGGAPPLANALRASLLKVGKDPRLPGTGRREMRIPLGKEPVVGVEGRTLTEVWGERATREVLEPLRAEGEAMEREFEEVEEALEREWLWVGCWA